ncbi:MAG: LamG domain-containing protein [Candidatus Omnitrophota bacterium]
MIYRLKNKYIAVLFFCFIALVVAIISSVPFRLKLARHYKLKNDKVKLISLYNKIYIKQKILSEKPFSFLKLSLKQRYEISRELANYFLEKGCLKKAEEHYEVLKELQPENAKEYLPLLILNHDPEALIGLVTSDDKENYRSFLPEEYIVSPFFRYSLAVSFAKKGQWKESAAILKGLASEYSFLRLFLEALTMVNNKKVPVNNFNIAGIWNFDENSGAVVKDSSGRWNYGKINGPARGRGLREKGLLFDGFDDYVSVERNRSLDLKDFSLCVWMKVSSDALPTAHILSNGESNGYIAAHKDCVVSAAFNDGSQWHYIQDYMYKANEWSFIVLTEADGVMNLYYNGNLIVGPIVTNSCPAFSKEPFFIGKRSDGQLFFDGSLDEVYLFSSALSSKEVKDMYKWFDQKREAI